MNIKNKNNLSFKSTPLHKVNVINAKTGELVPAVISKLNPRDDKDRAAIAEISKNWEGVSNFLMHSFTDGFTKDASKIENYRAIELINNNPLPEKIIGISKFFKEQNPVCIIPEKKTYLNVLISKPNFSFQNQRDRKVKGVGEILFGEVVNFAKKNKSENLNFYSSADDFYFKILDEVNISARDNEDFFYLNNHEFNIPNIYFGKIIDSIRQKYKINFSA